MARQASTGKWFPVLNTDTDDRMETFRASLGAYHGIDVADVEAVDWQGSPEDRDTITAALREGTYQGMPVIAPPPAVSPPDVRGFELDVKLALARPRLHALNRAYPLALWSLRAGDFAAVKGDIDDALAAAVITAEEHGIIVTKARERRLPGF